MADLNERFLEHRRRPDRRARLPDRRRRDRGRSRGPGARDRPDRASRTSCRCCWATWSSARRWPRHARPTTTPAPSRTRARPARGARRPARPRHGPRRRGCRPVASGASSTAERGPPGGASDRIVRDQPGRATWRLIDARRRGRAARWPPSWPWPRRLTRMLGPRPRRSSRRRARRGPALLRWSSDPEEFLNPVLLGRSCQTVQTALTGRCLAERLFGAGRRGRVVGLFVNVVVVFVLAEAAPEDLGGAAHRSAPPCSQRRPWVARRSGPLRMILAALIGLTNVILPGKGLKQGPFVSEEELLAMADVAAEDEVIERGAGAHRVDHRVRRHRRPRGDGAPPRHGHRATADSRGRRHGGRDRSTATAASRCAARASTTSSASSTPRT